MSRLKVFNLDDPKVLKLLTRGGKKKIWCRTCNGPFNGGRIVRRYAGRCKTVHYHLACALRYKIL